MEEGPFPVNGWPGAPFPREAAGTNLWGGSREVPDATCHPRRLLTHPDDPRATPGLATEYARHGAWLFRWRSYPPLVVLAYVVAATAFRPVPAGGEGWRVAWMVAGFAFGMAGLLVRAWTVGHVPTGTSGRGTRELRAETLNTQGVYSVVRHPLYLGNYLLWIGVPMLAGRPVAVVITTLVFWLYYERIMMVEERFLFEGFGETYRAWAARTPPFVPRLSGWVPSTHPFSIRFCLGRDYQALYGFVAATTLVELTRSLASGGGGRLAPGWWAYFVAGTAVYAVLHVLKRTGALEPPDER